MPDVVNLVPWLVVIVPFAVAGPFFIWDKFRTAAKERAEIPSHGPLVCSYCSHHISDDVQYLGQPVNCPSCHSQFIAPSHVPMVSSWAFVLPVVQIVLGLAFMLVSFWFLLTL